MSINFAQLENFVTGESDDLDKIHLWYERLSEYELDGNESPKEIDILVAAMKYLINFSFTAAEELKEVAEGEAIAMAEREAQWEETRIRMHEELDELREKLAGGAVGHGEEVFRAQVDSLKEENRQLQQAGRDRDREMADQRDRFENLMARTEALQRERDSLLYNHSQMEDTIRELNRRLSTKEDVKDEWEGRKLRQRNEQAIQLSTQIQVVVAQNEELRSEVARVSEALEEATRLIENTAAKYSELSETLDKTEHQLQSVAKDNIGLREKLEDKEHILAAQTGDLKDRGATLEGIIEKKNGEISELTHRLELATVEIQQLRARVLTDTTAEREAELERLRQELVSATKMARQLFGESERDGEEPTVQLQLRIMQLENVVEEKQKKLETLQADMSALEDTLVGKDESVNELTKRIHWLETLRFGDAADELRKLKEQLKFRDEQIGKLQRQCTLLQVELGKYADMVPAHKPLTQPRKTKVEKPEKRVEIERLPQKEMVSVKMPDEQAKEASREEVETAENQRESQIAKDKPSKTRVVYTEDVDVQALLIASLYEEVMQLMQELSIKDDQLKNLETVSTKSKQVIEETMARLRKAHEKIEDLSKEAPVQEEESADIKQIIEQETQNVFKAIRSGGTELERRLVETSRKLMSERAERRRGTRQRESLQRMFERTVYERDSIKKRLLYLKKDSHLEIARLQLNLDNSTLELSRLMNKVLNSVPMETYEKLRQNYIKVVGNDALNVQLNTTGQSPVELWIDIRSKPNEECGKEELMTQNAYLKKVVDILNDQNEFWNKECEILQNENEEIKRFLEDTENESDMKGVLGGIETRLLQTIREQAEEARDRQEEQKMKRNTREELRRRRAEWAEKETHLMHVITVLQKRVQQMHSNSVASVSLEQIELLRNKIGEVIQREKAINETKQKINDLRSEAERELASLRAQREAANAAAAITDPSGLERVLSGCLLNVSQLTSHNETLQKKISWMEAQLKSKDEEIIELGNLNEDYLRATYTMDIWKKYRDGREHEERRDYGRAEMGERAAEDSGRQGSDDKFDYHLDFDSDDDSGAVSEGEEGKKLVVRTIVRDNRQHFETQLRQVKETAEIFIQSYKQQLAQKDETINKYKQLINEKMNEAPKQVIKQVTVVKEVKAEDADMQRDLIAARKEIHRLKREVEDLEKSNINLYREQRSGRAESVSVALQTEAKQKPRKEPSESSDEEQEEDGVKFEEKKPAHQSTKTRISNEMIVIDDEETRRLKNEVLKGRNEIRSLQEKVHKLTISNKNLMATCEKIREDAILELTEKQIKSTAGRDEAEVLRLRSTAEMHVRENKQLKKRIEILREELGKAEAEQHSREAKGEVIKWRERKKLEESIVLLRRRLKESKDLEAVLKEQLDKKDKQLEEKKRSETSRQTDIDRMHKRILELKTEKEAFQKEALSGKSLGENLESLRKEMTQFNKENGVLRAQLTKLEQIRSEQHLQIEKLKLENENLLQKESIASSPEVLSAKGSDHSIERQRKRQQDEATMTSPKGDSSPVKTTVEESQRQILLNSDFNEMKRSLRLAELRYSETLERLTELQKEYDILNKEHSQLMRKYGVKQSKDAGAVAVLGDKLQAKDKEIHKLKSKIHALERQFSQ